LAGLMGAAFILLTPVTVLSWDEVVDGNAGYLRVELGDRLTITAAPELRRPQHDTDAFAAVALVALATLALTTRLFLSYLRPAPESSFSRFLKLCSAGAIVVAFDELMGIHETVGANTPWISDIPVLPAADNIIVLLYGIAGAVVLWLYREVLNASPVGRNLSILGVALVAVGIALDIAGATREETVEVTGVITLAAGLSMSILTTARDRLRALSPSA
jgi:hypothetical protein